MEIDYELFELYEKCCCASQGAFAITLIQEEEFVKNIESMNVKTKKGFWDEMPECWMMFKKS